MMKMRSLRRISTTMMRVTSCGALGRLRMAGLDTLRSTGILCQCFYAPDGGEILLDEHFHRL